MALAMSEVAQVVGGTNSELLTPELIETYVTAKLSALSWGININLVKVTDYAFVKVYRLIGEYSGRFNNDYFNMDSPKGGRDY